MKLEKEWQKHCRTMHKSKAISDEASSLEEKDGCTVETELLWAESELISLLATLDWLRAIENEHGNIRIDWDGSAGYVLGNGERYEYIKEEC